MVRAIAFAVAMIVAATLTWGHTLLDRPSTANACGATALTAMGWNRFPRR
jgi:hypothetical protein